MEVIYAGIVSAVALLFIFHKIGIKRICGYDVFIDVGATVLLAYIYSGTYSGMLAAVIGGAIISVYLWWAGAYFGQERLTMEGWKRV